MIGGGLEVREDLELPIEVLGGMEIFEEAEAAHAPVIVADLEGQLLLDGAIGFEVGRDELLVLQVGVDIFVGEAGIFGVHSVTQGILTGPGLTRGCDRSCGFL